MTIARLILLSGISLLLGLVGCQIRPFQTVALHDDPSRLVRLEVNPTVGRSHSHPADITTDEMAAVLSGVMIEESRSMSPLPSRHPAFDPTEVSFFAPLFAQGLRVATSEEIVTFTQTTKQTAIINTVHKVTSGGIFIDGNELHFVLGNYRSPTNYASDPGIGATLDGRSAPLKPIAPQQPKLDFEPATAIAPSREGIWEKLLRPERSEIVVLFKRLTSTQSDGDYKSN
ncbi:MAG: hypothetical protein KF722_11430 [Nitrospira sp.]|nr:hypothetical protein [Nitrospira sp.]